MAVTEIERQLAIDPNSSFAHALLSICLIEMHRDREATQAAKRAVYLAPDLSDTHYNLAKIFYIQKQLKPAKKAVQEAIHLEPEIADYFALLSVIQLAQGDRDRALSSAEQGLSLDAEHVLCLNLRGMALLRLRRYQEAQTTLDAAIFQEPENTAAYAIKGWLYLYCGNRDLAEECFRESLRLDPEQEQALTGIVEALKLRYSLYNFVFNYKSFLSRINIYLRIVCISSFVILSLFNWLFLLVPLSMLLLEITQALFNLILRFDTQWRALHILTH